VTRCGTPGRSRVVLTPGAGVPYAGYGRSREAEAGGSVGGVCTIAGPPAGATNGVAIPNGAGVAPAEPAARPVLWIGEAAGNGVKIGSGVGVGGPGTLVVAGVAWGAGWTPVVVDGVVCAVVAAGDVARTSASVTAQAARDDGLSLISFSVLDR
jgi:hypothetical protein